jgi:predicted amidohydrolase
MTELRMAVAQAAAVTGDPAANALTARRLLGAAKNLGAELVVFPELFLCGHDLEAIAAQPELAVMSLDEGPIGVMRGRCASLGIAAVVGGCLAHDDGRANVAVVIDGAGEIAAVYERINLAPEERSLFEPGNRPVTCEVAGFRVGLAIGSDADFPEHVRALALAGVEAIAAPAVFDPAGYALATAGDGEDVLVADVDRSALASVRAEVRFLERLRPEIYGDRGAVIADVQPAFDAAGPTAGEDGAESPARSRRRRPAAASR